MDVFVIRFSPSSLATDPTGFKRTWQIGPASNAASNDADEAIGALSCEQNIPSLAGTSC
jgi:hypothetical protein